MVDSSGSVTPYMGFVVEPYSYFLCYEIEDLEQAKSFLPDGFELVKTKIFDDDEPKYYGIFGCFNAHTSGFWGLRVEFYIIARDLSTGLVSWIIMDYDTNTITYDPKNGLSDPNASGSIITIDYDGIVTVDVNNDRGRHLVFDSDIKQGVMKALDKTLWIEGNLSVAYGKYKSIDDPGVFSLIFDSLEFEKALRIPKDAFNLDVNNWFPGLFKEEPSELLCFPYAQHFLSDSPGHASLIQTETQLEEAYKGINFDEISAFSTKAFKTSFVVGGIISIVTNLLLLKLALRKR